nr:hypothetical protein BHM03_00000279 [Ipomoea batatas]
MASLSSEAELALRSAPPFSCNVDAIKTGDCPNFFSNLFSEMEQFSALLPDRHTKYEISSSWKTGKLWQAKFFGNDLLRFRFLLLWSINAIESLSSKHTTGPDIDWPLYAIQTLHVNLGHMTANDTVYGYSYVEKQNISVSISVNPIKPVRELNKAHSLSQQWIHHETHRLPQRLAVVDVVIAVQIQHERRVRLFSLDTYTNLGARGSMSNFLQKGTHFLANSDTSDNASNVNMAAPSSET